MGRRLHYEEDAVPPSADLAERDWYETGKEAVLKEGQGAVDLSRVNLQGILGDTISLAQGNELGTMFSSADRPKADAKEGHAY